MYHALTYGWVDYFIRSSIISLLDPSNPTDNLSLVSEQPQPPPLLPIATRDQAATPDGIPESYKMVGLGLLTNKVTAASIRLWHY